MDYEGLRNEKTKSDYSFLNSLKSQAISEQEDVWMDWESIVVFLRKWQAVRDQVTKNDAA